ncbi:hypothetical protein BDN70DRAFT_971938 [Pholiota conissans]|uniref:Uncharacterized protein n=1 Tax=Pholiota conissans TaxID=109636 RepID=A0A9P5YLU8_9AGAR|nr:hypothetical protein BDN70DRAFT_971938 [Pholiota conissans]
MCTSTFAFGDVYCWLLKPRRRASNTDECGCGSQTLIWERRENTHADARTAADGRRVKSRLGEQHAESGRVSTKFSISSCTQQRDDRNPKRSSLGRIQQPPAKRRKKKHWIGWMSAVRKIHYGMVSNCSSSVGMSSDVGIVLYESSVGRARLQLPEPYIHAMIDDSTTDVPRQLYPFKNFVLTPVALALVALAMRSDAAGSDVVNKEKEVVITRQHGLRRTAVEDRRSLNSFPPYAVMFVEEWRTNGIHTRPSSFLRPPYYRHHTRHSPCSLLLVLPLLTHPVPPYSPASTRSLPPLVGITDGRYKRPSLNQTRTTKNTSIHPLNVRPARTSLTVARTRTAIVPPSTPRTDSAVIGAGYCHDAVGMAELMRRKMAGGRKAKGTMMMMRGWEIDGSHRGC